MYLSLYKNSYLISFVLILKKLKSPVPEYTNLMKKGISWSKITTEKNDFKPQ